MLVCTHRPLGPGSCTEHVCQGRRRARHDSHHAVHDKAAACVRWLEILFGCNKASINHSVSAGPTPDGGVGFQRDGEPFRCLGLMKCVFFVFFSLPSTPTLICMRSENQLQTHGKFFFFLYLFCASFNNEGERFCQHVREGLGPDSVCLRGRDLSQSVPRGGTRRKRSTIPANHLEVK